MKAIIIFLLLTTSAFALPEKHYQAACAGEIEFKLSDSTRVDCLTQEYAIEYDFAHKWAEAIGQSLHYSQMTGKKAGIVLIMGENDQKYYDRVINIIKHYNLPIKVWMVKK